MKLQSVFYVVILFLLGCSQPNIDYDELRNNQNITIKTFTSLSPNLIEDRKSIILSLGDKYQEVIQLKDTRIFAAKLILPEMKTRFSLKVATSESRGFFAPKILFLDKEFRVLKISKANDLFFDRGIFKGTIFVNKNYKKMKYIIVTEDEKYHDRKETLHYVTSSTIPITTGMYTFYYTTSSDDLNRTIDASHGGKVELMLRSYKASILGEKEE